MKIDELRPAYYSIGLLLLILLIGIIGYSLIEHYSLIDSFFMTIITVTTVGFEEVHPLTTAGKIFTSGLIVVSFGFFAFSVTTVTRYIVSGVFRNYFKFSKMKREIDKLENHVIVVGYGRNGSQAVEELRNHKIPLVVIENRDAKIKEIQQITGLLFLQEDPTSDEALVSAGVKRAKALISVLPTDEENLFVVLTTHELNKNITIISRAINFNTIKKLKIAGASHVIMPDKISGQQMAKMIAQPNAMEFLDYLLLEKSKETILEEIICGGLNIEQTLGSLIEKSASRLNVIGIKHKDGSYLVNPDNQYPINQNDCLFVLGKPDEIENFKKNMVS